MMLVGFLLNLISGIGAMAVARRRGASALSGLALGCLLGPLGLILSFVVFKGSSLEPAIAMAPAYLPLQAVHPPSISPPVHASFRCSKCQTAVAELRGFCPQCGSVIEQGQTAAAESPKVFISYAQADKATAEQVCCALEAAGVACWIAPRNISPGADYALAWQRAHLRRVMNLRSRSWSSSWPLSTSRNT